MRTQLSRTVEADDVSELLDVFLRCAMRFLICNHLFPNRLVEAGEESALRDDDKLLKDCCRQPDSDLQLAPLDGVVPEFDVAFVVEVLEEDTAVFSVP